VGYNRAKKTRGKRNGERAGEGGKEREKGQ